MRVSALLCAALAGCTAPPASPGAFRLTRQTAAATRLSVDRAALRPRRLIGLPQELTWKRVDAETEVAELPATREVEYLIKLRVAAADPRSIQLAVRADGRDLWETPQPIEKDGVVELEHRTAPAAGKLELKLTSHGVRTIVALEIREAARLTSLALGSAEDVDVRGFVRHTIGSVAMARTLESLLATGESSYEWPLPPSSASRALEVETSLVPRHGDPAALPPIEMRVESREGGAWRTVFAIARGADGDDGEWRQVRVELGRADAIRLVTHAGPRSRTVAWGVPTVCPVQRLARPDVVLLSIDALRPDHLGLYGHPGGLSPVIDALGRAGAVFDEARAQRGQTWESLTSLAWGLQPETIGVWERGLLPSRGFHGVADAFAEAGYLTARIGMFQMPPGQLGTMDVEEETENDQQTMERLRVLFARQHDRPIYVMTHLAATHYPYNPLPAFRTPETGDQLMTRDDFVASISKPGATGELHRVGARYDACIRQTDAALGAWVPALERADRAGGPALVAIVADHGSHQGEQGLWYLHSTIYRPVLHVPLIIHWPGHVAAGARSDRLVRLVDVGPTLLDYAGLDGGGFDGRSLRALIEGRPEPGRVSIAQVPSLGMVVVEDDQHKLIANPRNLRLAWRELRDRSLAIPTLQLYRWRTGPEDEAHDLSAREPLIAGELWRQVSAVRATLERNVAAGAERLLRQAGYGDGK